MFQRKLKHPSNPNHKATMIKADTSLEEERKKARFKYTHYCLLDRFHKSIIRDNPAPQGKIARLLWLSKAEVYNHMTPTETRLEWNRHKHHIIQTLTSPWDECYVCQRIPEDIHHIISIAHGGTNDKVNLIRLCRRCHTEIHSWMKGIKPIQKESRWKQQNACGPLWKLGY